MLKLKASSKRQKAEHAADEIAFLAMLGLFSARAAQSPFDPPDA